MKFQWSKVASVLGSYKDFIHAYTLSVKSANFANGQIEAQLDTINRKYEQLKATMTGIATGIGASGLSAYIKNILSSLNAFAKAIQKVPTNVWKAVGAVTAFVAAIGSGVVILKLFAGGISALVAGYGAYTSAVAAGTLATEGWAVATTVATGGLNILLAVLAAGVAAFLGYNAIVSQSIKTSDDLAQKGADAITAKEQEIQAMEKQTEWIATLCESHVKLQEELETTKEGTEQNIRAKEDLAATDNELAEVIGKNAVDKIDWSRNVQDVIRDEQAVIRNKIADEKKQLADAKLAQLNYTRNQVEWTKNRIEALKSEGYGWDALKDVIENFVHFLGRAMVTMGESFNAFQDTIRSTPILGKIAQMMGYGDEGSLTRNTANGLISTGNELQSFSGDYAQTAVDAFKKVPIIGQIAQWDIDHLYDVGGMGVRGGFFNSHSNRWNELEYQEEELRRLENQQRQENIDYLQQRINNYGNDDSGVVDEGGGGGTKGKAPKGSSGAGAKEADNSPEAMGFRYLMGKGLDKNFVLGILANIAHESSFNPDATNGDHWGMIQWDESRWGTFLNSYLAQRGMNQGQYYASDVNTKRTLQYDYIIYELMQGAEQDAYNEILKRAPSSPEQFAHLFNRFYERSGVYSGGTDWERQKTSREYATRFERNNGEDNYTDGVKAMEKAYDEAKKLFDIELKRLQTERAKEGQKVSAVEELKLYEKMMGIGDGKNPFSLIKKAQSDYAQKLLKVAEYEAKAREAVKKATDTQVQAVEKMADSEIAFAEKLGIMSKQDVWKYNYQKNEKNYATKKPFLDAQLGATVDMTKGSYDDMLEAYRGLIYAENELEAEQYANRMMLLSRDVTATKKALDEELKLEEKYQMERYKLEQEAFEHKNRYIIGFKDAFVSEWQSGLEGILNRTKTFGDAMRDMLKNLVNSMIKLFTEDWAKRLNKVLSNALFPQKETGYALGTNPDKGAAVGQMTSQYTAASLGSWASSNLSLMGGDKKGTNNGIVDTVVPQSAVTAVRTRTAQMKNIANQNVNAMKTYSQQAGQQMLAQKQANATAEVDADGAAVATEVATHQAGDTAKVASSNAAQSTIMANLAAMMTQMLAAMAIMAVFGAIFGGGGSKTETSTSEVNLGRSPDSYYMTPSAVMQSTTFQVPSFDIGGNIEQDMFAMVHKGEMVLTPEQAEVIRSSARTGGSMGNGSANANVKSSINVTTVSSRGFEQVLRDYNRDLSKNVKKGIRNGYLNAKGLV